MKVLAEIRQQEQALEWDEVKRTNHCTLLYASPCKDKLRHSVIIRQTKPLNHCQAQDFKVR